KHSRNCWIAVMNSSATRVSVLIHHCLRIHGAGIWQTILLVLNKGNYREAMNLLKKEICRRLLPGLKQKSSRSNRRYFLWKMIDRPSKQGCMIYMTREEGSC